MKTNDLKKGTKVRLQNGWEAIIEDNKKGNIRMAKVFGLYTEIGSIYSHDIEVALIDGQEIQIEHTPEQNALRRQVDNFF